jgi:hypothetical protein
MLPNDCPLTNELLNKNDRLSSNEKIVWVLVVIFLYALGALIYFFAGRKGGG